MPSTNIFQSKPWGADGTADSHEWVIQISRNCSLLGLLIYISVHDCELQVKEAGGIIRVVFVCALPISQDFRHAVRLARDH